jgi:hypothetical protein
LIGELSESPNPHRNVSYNEESVDTDDPLAKAKLLR